MRREFARRWQYLDVQSLNVILRVIQITVPDYRKILPSRVTLSDPTTKLNVPVRKESHFPRYRDVGSVSDPK